MAEPTSQNAATRDPGSDGRGAPGHRFAIALLGAAVLLVAAGMALDYLADSELGRTLDANLTRLADPRAWIP